MTQNPKKTLFFWFGLIIVTVAVIGLSSILWWLVNFTILTGRFISSYQLVYIIPSAVAGGVFIFTGAHMMRAGNIFREDAQSR